MNKSRINDSIQSSQRKEYIPLHMYSTCQPHLPQSRSQSSSAHEGQEGRALGNPGTKLPLIVFSKKTIKIFLIGHVQVRTTVSERAACHRVFLEMLKSEKHAQPIFDFSDSKTTLARLIRQNKWIPNFQIKYISYISKIDQRNDLNVKNKIKKHRLFQL